MQAGDWIVYYAPKEQFGQDQACQQIVACGQLVSDQVYQYQMAPGFVPYRRDVSFITIQAVPLTILRQLPGWQQVARRLRFGHVELSADFFAALCNV